MNEQIILIATTSEGNSFDRVVNEKKNTVFCTKHSVSQREFFDANSAGLKAELKFKLWTQDYNGELKAEYNGKRYKVYRTYENFDTTEIYLASEG